MRALRSLVLGASFAAAAGCASPPRPATRAHAATLEVGGDATLGAARELSTADALRTRARAVEVELALLDDAMLEAKDPASLSRRRDALAKAARIWSRQAAEAYTAFVDAPESRTSSARPRALASLARTLVELGDLDGARRRYVELLALPRVGRDAVIEARLGLADIAFAREELETAADEAQRAIALGPEPSTRARALYVRSWALRGVGETRRPGAFREALTALRDLLVLRGAPGVDRDLVDAAAREIVDVYLRHGEPRDAERFFAPLGPEGARLLADLRFRAAGGERLGRPRLPTVLGGDKTL